MRVRGYVCVGVAAVTLLGCAQARADADATTMINHANFSSSNAADGNAMSGKASRVGAPSVNRDRAFHHSIDRETDLATLSFSAAPYATSDVMAPPSSEPMSLGAPLTSDGIVYSPYFRARGRSMLEVAPSSYAPQNPSTLGSNMTVWQRMQDYQGHGRVRVLTLWENTAGAVSLQAGKGGSPSLQWTSSWVGHGDATRGVLDGLFAVSIAGAANTIRNVTHGAGQLGQSARDTTKLAAAAAAETTAR